jgi:hypothetical protein
MEPGEDKLFLKLGTATKILTQFEITSQEIDRAGDLITEYLLEYKSVSGTSTVWVRGITDRKDLARYMANPCSSRTTTS